MAHESILGILTDTFVLYLILVALAPLTFYEIGALLAPSSPKRVKRMAFESGQTPLPWRISPFPIEYFPYVIIYIAYAVLALIAFMSVLPLMTAREGALRAVIVLAVIAASSIYLSTQLRNVVQRI